MGCYYIVLYKNVRQFFLKHQFDYAKDLKTHPVLTDEYALLSFIITSAGLYREL